MVEVDEALRITVDLNEQDLDILGKMYDARPTISAGAGSYRS
jgi:hypothetical protein